MERVKPTAGDLIRVVKPTRIQAGRWSQKYYLGRLLLLWEHEEVDLRRKQPTATAAWLYACAVRHRFVRMYTPEESRP